MTSDDDEDMQRRQAARRRFEQGLPDYHDPISGLFGAPPALSALTLRLVLAVFGLLVCTAGAVGGAFVDVPLWFTIVLLTLAVIAVIDIAVIIRRKRRGEPG